MPVEASSSLRKHHHPCRSIVIPVPPATPSATAHPLRPVHHVTSADKQQRRKPAAQTCRTDLRHRPRQAAVTQTCGSRLHLLASTHLQLVRSCELLGGLRLALILPGAAPAPVFSALVHAIGDQGSQALAQADRDQRIYDPSLGTI